MASASLTVYLQLQIYEGKVDPWVMSDNCTDNVPVLIKRATFCSAFAADARDFRAYNSWVRRLYPYWLFGYQSLHTVKLTACQYDTKLRLPFDIRGWD